MTVCIAAICRDAKGHPAVVGASDRMLSTPDYQWEPKQPKIFPFVHGCVALVAGDTTQLASIIPEGTRREWKVLVAVGIVALVVVRWPGLLVVVVLIWLGELVSHRIRGSARSEP